MSIWRQNYVFLSKLPNFWHTKWGKNQRKGLRARPAGAAGSARRGSGLGLKGQQARPEKAAGSARLLRYHLDGTHSTIRQCLADDI